MTTLHFTQTTSPTPEQFIAGLTDFGPDRSEVFPNSADDYLKVHDRGPTGPMSPRARRGPGSGCTTTGPTPTSRPDHDRLQRVGRRVRATPTRSPAMPDGTTDIDWSVVRDGKNLKGRFFASSSGRSASGSSAGPSRTASRPSRPADQKGEPECLASERGAGDVARPRSLCKEYVPHQGDPARPRVPAAGCRLVFGMAIPSDGPSRAFP